MRMFPKALIFLLFASGMVLAQYRIANLSGTVADEAGMPLEGAEIKMTILAPSRDFVGPTLVRVIWSGLTGEDGNYKVPGLLLGTYQTEASMAGFDTNSRWVPLRTSADEMILDITLKAEGVPEAAQAQTSPPGPEGGEPDARISPPPAEPPPTNQRGSTGSRTVRLAIQIAAFQTRQQAEGLRVKLENAGFAAYIAETDVLSSTRYFRVRLGPFDTEEEAQAAASNVRIRFPQEITDLWIVSYRQ